MESKIKLWLTFVFFALAHCELTEFVRWQTLRYKNLPSKWSRRLVGLPDVREIDGTGVMDGETSPRDDEWKENAQKPPRLFGWRDSTARSTTFHLNGSCRERKYTKREHVPIDCHASASVMSSDTWHECLFTYCLITRFHMLLISLHSSIIDCCGLLAAIIGSFHLASLLFRFTQTRETRWCTMHTSTFPSGCLTTKTGSLCRCRGGIQASLRHSTWSSWRESLLTPIHSWWAIRATKWTRWA